MKKLLSIILAAAMLMSLVPSVFAEGEEQELELSDFFVRGASTPSASKYVNSVLEWTKIRVRRYSVGSANTINAHVQFGAIKVNVTKAGEYNIYMKTDNPTETSVAPAIAMGKYSDSMETATNTKTLTEDKGKILGYFNFSKAPAGEYAPVTVDGNANGEKSTVVLEAGDNYILFVATPKSVELNPYVKDSSGATQIAKDGTNSNENKNNGYQQQMYLSGIKLVPAESEEVAEGTVSFAETTNIDGFDNIEIKSVSRGEAVELTAHKKEIEGYKFIGWKRGSDTSDKNSWVEISGDTYNVWTNTYLTAIYEKETDAAEKAVEFWNQNGAYIGKMDEATYNAQETLFTPSLVGFGNFLGWFTEEDVPFTAGLTLADGITNAVAQYSASSVSGVKFGGNTIPDADTYDKEIELSATTDATTCWKRDGEIIAYGDSYTFNVWDATEITEGTEEISDKVPVAVLDYSEKYNAYMLEYDAGDYEIVEAGIIFGKDTTDMKRFTSQRKVSHNQFTVPEEEGLDATGYIVYTLDKGASYKFTYVTVPVAE